MLAVSGGLLTNILLVVVAVPSASVGVFFVLDRHRRAETNRLQKDQQQTIELIGTAFYGPDKSKWPVPGQTGRPAMATLVEAVAHQVRPSNGSTVADTVEEVKQLIEARNQQLDEMHQGMVKWGVLVAEHVSDGHGGQRSW